MWKDTAWPNLSHQLRICRRYWGKSSVNIIDFLTQIANRYETGVTLGGITRSTLNGKVGSHLHVPPSPEPEFNILPRYLPATGPKYTLGDDFIANLTVYPQLRAKLAQEVVRNCLRQLFGRCFSEQVCLSVCLNGESQSHTLRDFGTPN